MSSVSLDRKGQIERAKVWAGEDTTGWKVECALLLIKTYLN